MTIGPIRTTSLWEDDGVDLAPGMVACYGRSMGFVGFVESDMVNLNRHFQPKKGVSHHIRLMV